MKKKPMIEYVRKLPRNLIYYWGAARFFIPFLLFQFPLFTTITADIFDRVDSLFAYNAGWTWEKYLTYDKIFDWWWYVFILLYSIDKPIFVIILPLFVWRTVGQVLTLVTKKSELLVYFPNVLELYFWVYIFINFVTPSLKFILEGNYNLILLLVCSTLAVLRELYTCKQ